MADTRKFQQGKNYSQRGATMIESAMTLGLFFVFLLSIFDLLWLSYNALVVQYITSEVARTMTRSSFASCNNMATPAASESCRANAIAAEVSRMTTNFGLPLKNASTSNCDLSLTNNSKDRICISRIFVDYVNYGFKVAGTNITANDAGRAFNSVWGRRDKDNGGKGGEFVLVEINRHVNSLIFGRILKVASTNLRVTGISIGRNEYFSGSNY